MACSFVVAVVEQMASTGKWGNTPPMPQRRRENASHLQDPDVLAQLAQSVLAAIAPLLLLLELDAQLLDMLLQHNDFGVLVGNHIEPIVPLSSHAVELLIQLLLGHPELGFYLCMRVALIAVLCVHVGVLGLQFVVRPIAIGQRCGLRR